MKMRPVKQTHELREYLALERRAHAEGIDVAQLERWRQLKRQIEKRLGTRPAPPGAEQRRSVRIPLSLKVVFSTREELSTSLLQNLSRGGFYIETKEPLPIGTIFSTRIKIEEWKLEVNPSVRVVSSHASRDLASASGGMGVAFHELCEADQRTVDAIYELCLGAALERRENADAS